MSGGLHGALARGGLSAINLATSPPPQPLHPPPTRTNRAPRPPPTNRHPSTAPSPSPQRAYADSKTLTEAQREALFGQVEADEDLVYIHDVLSAATISAQMLGR